MTSSATDLLANARATTVAVTDDSLSVDLDDGRTVTVPLEWFPRLVAGFPDERGAWRLIGGGHGIHWEALDEDISVEGLLSGRRSAETKASIARWTARRADGGVSGPPDMPDSEDLAGTVNRRTMMPWVLEALRELGGRAKIVDVNKVVWNHHSAEIQASGDDLFRWQYEIRWTGDLLRKDGLIQSSEGEWILADQRKL